MAEVSLAGYLFRVILGVGLFALMGWAALKYLPRRMGAAGKDVALIASMSFGKDALYVLRIGPDVVAVMSGKNGADIISRWSIEDWNARSLITQPDDEADEDKKI